MQPTVLLTLAAHSVAKNAKKPASPPPPAPRAAREKSSHARTALRVLAALAGGLVLVLSLVDPLLGSGQFETPTAFFEQGVRHG